MKCYYHEDRSAVGICKACFKAICKECSSEVNNSLACKETCASEVDIINKITAYSKRFVGVDSQNRKKIPANIVPYMVLSIIFLCVFLFSLFVKSKLDIAALVITIGMGFVTIYQFRASKEL